MNQTITVKITRNYGQEAVYPACEASRLFAEIAGTKTLSRPTLLLIRKMGYNIAVEAPALEIA